LCSKNRINERYGSGLYKEKFKKTNKLILLTRDTEEKRGDIVLLPLWKWLLEKT